MNDHTWTLVILVVLVAGFFRWTGRVRIRRSWQAPERDNTAEQAAMHARIAALEQMEGRVAELENRLDFTERVLAQRSAVDRGD